MSVIWKYVVPVVDRQELSISSESRFLSAQVQHGEITLWFLVEDPDAPKEPFVLHIYGTGNPIEEPLDDLFHLATVQQHPFVWHLFEHVAY